VRITLSIKSAMEVVKTLRRQQQNKVTNFALKTIRQSKIITIKKAFALEIKRQSTNHTTIEASS